MLGKLETKLQREVQQRIECQKKLNQHLHDTGAALEARLLSTFDIECHQLQQQVAALQENLAQWEPALLRDLTDNRQSVNRFDREC